MNIKWFLCLTLSIALIPFYLSPSILHAGGVVEGKVVDSLNRPIPGVSVTIFNNQNGRSDISKTNDSGRFTIYNVPMRQTYYIEVHWGEKLIYRNKIRVDTTSEVNIIIQQ